MNKDEVKNSLTLENIFTLLEEFGANPTLRENTIIADTICHNHVGEGSRKLYYYENTKLFKCYTSCDDSFDIFGLMEKINEDYSLPRAIEYISNKFNIISFTDNGFDLGPTAELELYSNYKRLLDKQNKEKEEIKLKAYDEKILKGMAHPLIGNWLKEGITKKTMEKYEISYYPKDCQIVIPHRDINGNLVGIRGRTVIQEEGELYGKYRPMIINGKMYNHPLGFNLYGLNYNKENISIIKKAVIFESEKSVMKYDSYFGSDNNISVAVCGSSLSIHQFELLRDLGVQEIIFAFDKEFKKIGDNEFQINKKKLQKMADKFKNYVLVSCIFDKLGLLEYKSSPIDGTKEVFMELLKNRIIL